MFSPARIKLVSLAAPPRARLVCPVDDVVAENSCVHMYLVDDREEEVREGPTLFNLAVFV